MTYDVGIVFAVIAGAFGLFVWGRIPVDQVALAVPVVLLLSGVVSQETAISGLSSPATVTVAAMLVLSLGLSKTGAVSIVSRWACTAPLGGPRTRLLLLCSLAALVSPFMNNTAVVVVFIPVIMEVARHVGEPPSRHLIPLSYATILGGTVSVVGTSTNLIVVGMAQERGLGELGMFSIAPLGLIYLAVGLTYLFTVGRGLLPARETPPDIARKYDVRSFITEMEVDPGSPVIDRTLESLAWGSRYGVHIVGIQRGDTSIPAPGARRVLRAGDVLMVQGDTAALLRLGDEQKLSSPERRVLPRIRMNQGEGKLVEFLVSPGCDLVDQTLEGARFQQRYDAIVLAVQRHGVIRHERLAEIRLEVGDILLVHGTATALERMLAEPGFVSLGEVERPLVSQGRALFATVILLGVVLAAGTGLASILTAALTGVAFMVFGRCISLRDIYEELDWSVVFLLAGLIPLGIAMDQTGAAAWIGDGLASSMGDLGPVAAVAVFYLVTSLLTEVMSNNASAVVLTPIAVSAAAGLGMNPYALLVAVMFGASASFMTPIGYQTNALVLGPGGYRFRDFVRVGAPLNLLLLVTASLLIPVLWPS